MALLDLESFDLESEPEVVAPSFDDGFAAGYAAAWAEASSARTEVAGRLVDALAALPARQADAEARLMAALAPLFEAITTQLLPALVHEAIGPRIVDLLLSRSADLVQGAEQLRLSAEDLPGVQAALTASGLAITVVPDQALSPGQAALGAAAGNEEFVDLTEVVAAVRSALEALAPPRTGDPRDG